MKEHPTTIPLEAESPRLAPSDPATTQSAAEIRHAKKYTPPRITTYSDEELLELIGPGQAGGYFNPFGVPELP